ncbi:MAG: 50S ribosomal protein L22 [Candidatus Auribacterota bacterium]|uniref:Large ribosomal subunit protein uL22 n=1 Tax=Candidatus Auribacter fodinae TaxID=2093366 RepID=A0A3A4R059_9BACT|nr:MAG: 50S ribosomal protein L22 [Candidatus Auribacter fodinae]
MEARAVWKYARVSPRKMRLIADAIRGKDVNTAVSVVKYTNRKAAGMMEKLLKSAVANMESKSESSVDINSLKVKTVFVDGGPMMKRFMPRAMGRASKILKRTSHITVVVGDSE